MKVRTKLGEMEIPEDKVITFEEGIPGFEHLRKFAIVSNGSDPIMWLVSLEDDKIAFPVINPWLVRVDYTVDIPKEVLEELDIEKESDAQVWAILVIPREKPEDMTINLLAPIVISLKSNKGKQIIMEDSGYDIRHLVREELERSRRLTNEVSASAG